MADETEQVLLRRAMQQFEQMELLVQLTRGMVHDLNNMFSVVSQNLYLAHGDEGIPQSTRDRLQQIEMAIEKGVGLMKKLARFSRAEEFQSKPFEINHAVKTATQLARPLLGNRIRVKHALAPDLPVVEGDSGEIDQALVRPPYRVAGRNSIARAVRVDALSPASRCKRPGDFSTPPQCAAMLAAILAGVSPAGGTCPVATVAITGDGKGDQSVGSPVVKTLVGWAKAWSGPSGG